MKIIGLHHAQITVPKNQEAAARQFYCGTLRLPEIPKPDSLKSRPGFWLQVGDRQVHVRLEDGVDRALTQAHLAYEVDDVAAWRNKLVSTGISTLDSLPIEGFERFEFRDPFGNRVEMIQPLV
jgi:catechol 2,3-dioxygenase-like lactoylglutathione lyase family enzyme